MLLRAKHSKGTLSPLPTPGYPSASQPTIAATPWVDRRTAAVGRCDLWLRKLEISVAWQGGECPRLAAAAGVYVGGGCVVG
jgi:hypothetical protein